VILVDTNPLVTSRTGTIVAMPRTPPAALPGEDLIRQGLTDLAAGRETAAALLIAIGADRLRAAGVRVPSVAIADPEHRLYAMLAARSPRNAHAEYNALVRRLVSFERALEHRRRRARPTSRVGAASGARTASTDATSG
jgi:hypothetical protein